MENLKALLDGTDYVGLRKAALEVLNAGNSGE